MSENQAFVSRSEARAPFFVGIDVGATCTTIGVVDDLGRPISRVIVPTEPGQGTERHVARIGVGVREAAGRAGLAGPDIVRVGLGATGTVDLARGALVAPARLTGWDGFPLRDRVSEHCELPVSFDSSANAAAYGEFWVGAGRDSDSIVLLTIDSEIDCGMVFDDLLSEGEHLQGAECGHMIIHDGDDARTCACGQRGHLEAYASTAAIIGRTRQSLDAGRSSSLSRRLADGESLTPKLVAEEAESGDQLALEIVLDTASHLAVGIVNLMHTVDPEAVLVGGASAFGGEDTALGSRFLERLRTDVARRAFPFLAQRTVVKLAGLGSAAGFIGAAGIARREHQRPDGA